MEYQINKIHNLKLAAKSINKIVIAQNDIFHFGRMHGGQTDMKNIRMDLIMLVGILLFPMVGDYAS